MRIGSGVPLRYASNMRRAYVEGAKEIRPLARRGGLAGKSKVPGTIGPTPGHVAVWCNSRRLPFNVIRIGFAQFPE